MDILDTPITFGLIAANIVLSLLAFQNRQFMERNLFVVGPILQDREYHRLVSSGFLHLNFPHLFINMYVLFLVGTALENILGPVRFTVLYGLSLIGGSLWSLMENKRNYRYSALGASGATSGLLIAYCFAAPGQWFVFPPVPAWLLAIGSFFITALLARRPDTRIGHDAHLGGMIFGGAYMLIIKPELWRKFISTIESSLNFF